jgi:prevent-host-death family protein
MASVTQRELRNQSAAVMDRVERGEELTVTRNGRPVAMLKSLAGPHKGVLREELLMVFADLPPLSLAELRQDADRFFADDGDRAA